MSIKGGKFDPAPSETPEPIVTKICTGNYVRDLYHYAKLYYASLVVVT